MKIETAENGTINFSEVFNPIVFYSTTGEKLVLEMKNGGFELTYDRGKSPGIPFRKLIRLVNEKIEISNWPMPGKANYSPETSESQPEKRQWLGNGQMKNLTDV